MTDRRDDVLDETILRRALRLEDDEHGARFDPAAFAAMAQNAAPSSRALVVALVATAVTGLVATAVWSVALGAGSSVLDGLLAVALDGVIAGATILAPIAEIAAQPAVPLSLLAALGVAILYELRERREYTHVHAS